jgi:uncharacterized RDD family membrane protein YckC
MEQQEENLFDESAPVPASMGKRLVNYLVDMIASALALQLVMAALYSRYPAFVKNLTLDPYDFRNLLTIWLFVCVFLSLQEALLHGKTLGKMITRTRAVRLDGSPISTELAFTRSIIRAVPFEAFSILIFGRPWHDRWSRTMVIDEKLSAS